MALQISSALLIFFMTCCSVSAELVNIEIKRVIDVKGRVAISRTGIHMKNTGSEPVNTFYVAVHADDAKGIGDIWVADPTAGKPLRALGMTPSDAVPGLNSTDKGFEVMLPKPVAANGEVIVDLRMDITSALMPVPEVIERHDVQYMRYIGSSYFYTPYETKEMTTSITLGSATVTTNQGLEKPFEISGDKVTLGPYKDVAPFSHNEIVLRFKNDRGFLVANSASKEFYVNHLGNIAVKEEFKVINAGAKHSGEWSRVDHASALNSKYGSVLGDVWANLPPDAVRVSYKDLIGNITSSHLREPSKGKRAIQLVYRFPLMGGWHNHFWINYEMLLANYIRSSAAEHELTLPLFPSLNTDLICKELQIEVFLPEWSHSIEVVPHESLSISPVISSQRTTLTMIGRPVVSFKLKMLRSQSKHARTVVIRYKYNTGLAWIAPGVVALGIFFLFAGLLICMRAGLDIVEEKDEIAKEKAKVKNQ